MAIWVYPTEHISLFNGKDLTGWHTQGDCEWTVENGSIMGYNTNGNWCHLVTDSSYTDYYISLNYRILRGNSGLYVRVRNENTGCCGLQGVQVDFGPSQDGSVMLVMDDSNSGWYELITRAVDEGLVDYSDWNKLEVEVQGTGISTFVNGHAIYSTDTARSMFPAGNIALQLHTGGAGDTILFKDLELYLPRRVPGCLDTSMLEYDSAVNFAVADSCKTKKVAYCPDPRYAEFKTDGNFPDSGLCKTLGLDKTSVFNKMTGQQLLINLSGGNSIKLPAGIRGVELYNTRGQMVWMYRFRNNSNRNLIKIPSHIEKGVLRVWAIY